MSHDPNRETPARAPKVSVCDITYNQRRYLAECLQSLVDQKANFDFEIIVGDDCSTDGTRAVVEEFAQKYPGLVRAILQEKNTGGSKNNLDVHAAALGEYVAHVDGDDYALPGKLQAQADVLDAEPRCKAVWHRVHYFDDLGGFCSGRTADLSSFKDGRVLFADAIRLGFIGVHSSLMYRRSARENVDPNRQILDIYITWDLVSKGFGHIVGDVLGCYRVGATGSLTTGSQRKVRLLAIEHADQFLGRFPRERRNFFIWAFSNALADARNRRDTLFDFLRLSLRCLALVGPWEIASNLVRMRRTQVRWGQRDRPESRGV